MYIMGHDSSSDFAPFSFYGPLFFYGTYKSLSKAGTLVKLLCSEGFFPSVCIVFIFLFFILTDLSTSKKYYFYFYYYILPIYFYFQTLKQQPKNDLANSNPSYKYIGNLTIK